jgi:hypothetical protein
LLRAVDEYQYATMSAYSPTMSELQLAGKRSIYIFSIDLLTLPNSRTRAYKMAVSQSNRMDIEQSNGRNVHFGL